MNELATAMRCVRVYGGVEIWIDEARAIRLQELLDDLLQQGKKKMLEIDGEFVTSDQVVGIFTPGRMEEVSRRKNGQWQCKLANWHERGQKCGCRSEVRSDEEQQFYRENGFYQGI